MKSSLAGISIVGILCALAVCSSRTAYARTAADPCKLLTQAQVSSAVFVVLIFGVQGQSNQMSMEKALAERVLAGLEEPAIQVAGNTCRRTSRMP
jgi:hypothetical protein